MNINFGTYIVRGADGAPDTDATIAKFASDLDSFIAERETEDSVIAAAVHTVFDSLKAAGTRGNMPYIISMALTNLNVSAHPAMYKGLSEKIHAYLSNNSQGKTDKETGLVERPESLFIIGRGKGAAAGVRRRSDLPVESK